MKKLLTYPLMYFLCIGAAYAQLDESRNFLYLNSDSVVYARTIDLERNFAGALYFWVDSRRVNPDQVKFFNNERGFFANTKDLTFTGQTAFSERIRKGKINLYEESNVAWDRNYDWDYPYYNTRPRAQVYNSNNYYNTGYGPLKKANYVNLCIDMADNARCMELLKKYQSLKNTRTAMYVGAGVSVLAGMAMILTRFGGGPDVSSPNFSSHVEKASSASIVPSLLLFGLGAGLSVGGYSISVSSPKYLKQAIDTYNE